MSVANAQNTSPLRAALEASLLAFCCLSLLLAIAVGWLNYRSFDHYDGADITYDVHHETAFPTFNVGGWSQSGRIMLFFHWNRHITRPPFLSPGSREVSWRFGSNQAFVPVSVMKSTLGFYWNHFVGTQLYTGVTLRQYSWTFMAPHCFYGCVFSLPAIIVGLRVWRSRRRERRRSAGLCEACGYDLRASLSRCPECGLAVEQQLNAATARSV